MDVPLHRVNLKSDLVKGVVNVGVRESLPIEGISLLLGNDLAGDKVTVEPQVVDIPITEKNTAKLEEEFPDIFPACVVTRSMTAKTDKSNHDNPSVRKIRSHIGDPSSNNETSKAKVSDSFGPDSIISRMKLIEEQEKDPDISVLLKKTLTDDEAEKVPTCYLRKQGVLMRKWRPPEAPTDEEWNVVYQIVVPSMCRQDIISLAHETPMSGHLGINKTYDRILKHFFWPKLKQDVTKFCKSCHVCQVVGKPNQKIAPAPLSPIPAFEEPFSRVIIDCVGPLPKTASGNEYILTIMCASTRFPEAIPLRNIKTKTITKALVKFFTSFGLPKSLQSDQGSNFMSHIFQQVMYQLQIKQYRSSPYHPESQGALERFHQTLKTMLKTYCHQNLKDWDEGIPLLMFAVRDSVQESLGFSPFELVFGHTVRGPLVMLKEKWLEEENNQTNILQYVLTFKNRLLKAGKFAKENLKKSQGRMKLWYDKKARLRTFKPGDKVLVLFPSSGNSLQAQFFGPYEVERKVNDLNYIVKTPGRRKESQLCHINMLKVYQSRNTEKQETPVVTNIPVEIEIKPECGGSNNIHTERTDINDNLHEPKLQNSVVLSELDRKLYHLEPDMAQELADLIRQYEKTCETAPLQGKSHKS